MLFKVTFKTPDVVDSIIEDLGLEANKERELRNLTDKYIKYDEYITVEFNTDNGTVRVVPL